MHSMGHGLEGKTMNKRQTKKKEKRENNQISVWGYTMPYRTERKIKRMHREACTKSYWCTKVKEN